MDKEHTTHGLHGAQKAIQHLQDTETFERLERILSEDAIAIWRDTENGQVRVDLGLSGPLNSFSAYGVTLRGALWAFVEGFPKRVSGES